MKKIEKQQLIFKNFMKADLMVSSNHYGQVNLKKASEGMKYYIVLGDVISTFKKDPTTFIVKLENDDNGRFIKRWKIGEMDKLNTLNGGVSQYLIGLDSNNEWDKKIINAGEKLCKGGEDIMEAHDCELVKVG